MDYDLSALAAPLEALRNEVDEAYKRLDAYWKAVATELRNAPIPCDIGFCFEDSAKYPDRYRQLEWRKWKGKKRLCIVDHDVEKDPTGIEQIENVTPYEEWSADERVEMLQHVPQLFRAAKAQTEVFIKKTML